MRTLNATTYDIAGKSNAEVLRRAADLLEGLDKNATVIAIGMTYYFDSIGLLSFDDDISLYLTVEVEAER